MMHFSSENLRNVFADENDFNSYRKLAFDLLHGNEITEYDDNNNLVKISKKQANDGIRKVFMKVLDLTEDDLKSAKKRHRAIKRHGMDLFEINEEDIDFRIVQGFQDSEWFNELVDSRNIAMGDANEFVPTVNDAYMVATRFSGDQHDVTMQQLRANTPFMVPTTAHVVKTGKDIDLILLGRIDYTTWVQKVADAFIKDIQQEVFDSIYSAYSKLPTGDTFVKEGTMADATNKDKFDELIENVETANDSEVYIVGTKTALKKLNNLADVDWRSDSQKEAVANTGRLGMYEGSTLIEVPQRFKIGSFTKIVPNDKLLIIAADPEDKFVKFVDEGETEILEVTEKGELADDFQTYEIQRRYGVSVVLSQYFGQWTID